MSRVWCQMVMVGIFLQVGCANAEVGLLKKHKSSDCSSEELISLLEENYSDREIFRYARAFEDCDLSFWFEAPMRVRHATKGTLTVYTREKLTVKSSVQSLKKIVCLERHIPSLVGKKPFVTCR